MLGPWDWSWDLTIKAVSSLTAFGALITAIFAGAKYIYEKNRDVYIRRLNEVYAPLYGFLIRQEQLREIKFPHITRKEFPILTLSSKKVKRTITFGDGKRVDTTSEEKEEILSIVDRKNFIKIFNDTNKGLARPELLLLIHKYEMLIHLEESTEHDEDWERASAAKVLVENEIFDEIVSGYIETIRKMDMGDRKSLKNIKKFLLK
jgi:hypothetical protein